jgi:hypothetical protein
MKWGNGMVEGWNNGFGGIRYNNTEMALFRNENTIIIRF